MSTTKKRASALTSHDLLAVAEAMLPEISAAADEADDCRAASLTGWRSG